MKRIDISFLDHTSLYGPPPEHVYQNENETTIQQQNTLGSTSNNNNISFKSTSIGIWIVLFVLGICAIISKKMSKTTKTLVIAGIVAIGIAITIIIKHLL